MTDNEIRKILVEAAIEVHRGLKLGLVINFGERYVKEGIHRVVNGL
jgi:hypothetical protein